MQKAYKIVHSFREVDMSDLQLPTIAIFFSPLDVPDKYIARLFEREYPTDTVVIGDSLEEVRKAMPINFVPFRRFKEEPASVVEVWI